LTEAAIDQMDETIKLLRVYKIQSKETWSPDIYTF